MCIHCFYLGIPYDMLFNCSNTRIWVKLLMIYMGKICARMQNASRVILSSLHEIGECGITENHNFVYLQKITCTEPSHLEGKALINISQEEFCRNNFLAKIAGLLCMVVLVICLTIGVSILLKKVCLV